MKGSTMQAISALLDRVHVLLTTEPARLIGYGAAVVFYLVANFLASRGILQVQLSFDESLGAAFGAIGSLIVIVESIRRAVYSPQTHVEQLSDARLLGFADAEAEAAATGQIDWSGLEFVDVDEDA